MPILQQIEGSAGEQHISAVLPRAGSDVDDPIRLADDIQIMLNQTYDADISLKEWLEKYPIREPVRLYAELTREGARQCESIPWLEKEIAMGEEHRRIVDTTVDRNDLEYVTQVFLRLGTEAKVINHRSSLICLGRRQDC